MPEPTLDDLIQRAEDLKAKLEDPAWDNWLALMCECGHDNGDHRGNGTCTKCRCRSFCKDDADVGRSGVAIRCGGRASISPPYGRKVTPPTLNKGTAMCDCGKSMKASPSKQELDYRAESDFRTLKDAEEVRSDKARHGRALGHGRKQIANMSRVMGRSMVKTGRAPKRMPAR